MRYKCLCLGLWGSNRHAPRDRLSVRAHTIAVAFMNYQQSAAGCTPPKAQLRTQQKESDKSFFSVEIVRRRAKEWLNSSATRPPDGEEHAKQYAHRLCGVCVECASHCQAQAESRRRAADAEAAAAAVGYINLNIMYKSYVPHAHSFIHSRTHTHLLYIPRGTRMCVFICDCDCVRVCVRAPNMRRMCAAESGRTSSSSSTHARPRARALFSAYVPRASVARSGGGAARVALKHAPVRLVLASSRRYGEPCGYFCTLVPQSTLHTETALLPPPRVCVCVCEYASVCAPRCSVACVCACLQPPQPPDRRTAGPTVT